MYDGWILFRIKWIEMEPFSPGAISLYKILTEHGYTRVFARFDCMYMCGYIRAKMKTGYLDWCPCPDIHIFSIVLSKREIARSHSCCCGAVVIIHEKMEKACGVALIYDMPKCLNIGIVFNYILCCWVVVKTVCCAVCVVLCNDLRHVTLARAGKWQFIFVSSYYGGRSLFKKKFFPTLLPFHFYPFSTLKTDLKKGSAEELQKII